MMDALIINLKNKIEKLITTILTPLSLITTERMTKIDTIDSNVDVKVSSRASQTSLTNVSAKVDYLVDKTVNPPTTLIGFEEFSISSSHPRTNLSLVGRGTVTRISGFPDMVPFFIIKADNVEIWSGRLSIGYVYGSLAPFALNINFNQSLEIITPEQSGSYSGILNLMYSMES